MDAGIQSQGGIQVCAILDFWIAAIRAAMTLLSLQHFLFTRNDLIA
jgi:hypothetical protein